MDCSTASSPILSKSSFQMETPWLLWQGPAGPKQSIVPLEAHRIGPCWHGWGVSRVLTQQAGCCWNVDEMLESVLSVLLGRVSVIVSRREIYGHQVAGTACDGPLASGSFDQPPYAVQVHHAAMTTHNIRRDPLRLYMKLIHWQ